MTYAAWERRHRCLTMAPGKLDLFVLTLVEGKLGALDSVLDYDAALERARVFHRDNRVRSRFCRWQARSCATISE